MYHEDVSGIGQAFRRGDLTASALIEDILSRIAAQDARLGAFAAVDADGAREAARRVDAEAARTGWKGPLHGIPFGAKDLLASERLPTEVGLAVFEGRMAGFDATTIARLKSSGAIRVGKLTQTEGTFGGYRPGAKVPLNPWDQTIWPGASSSGPAVAVAARLCPLALASDTGGSIRAPAAACGITGLLPTHGRVSRHGAFPLAAAMDRIGPLATSAHDCAHVLRAIAGRDRHDPATLDEPVPDLASELGTDLKGLSLGFDPGVLDGADHDVGAAIDTTLHWFAGAGMRIVPKAFPPTAAALDGWVALTAAGAAQAHAGLFPGNEAAYGAELRALIELGQSTRGIDLSRAIADQADLTGRMLDLHRDIDALLVPVSKSQTPSVLAFAGRPGIADSYRVGGQFTGSYSLSGLPTITFPAGFTRAGLPIGLQLSGRPFSEARLLHLAHRFQQASDWHLRVPRAWPG